MVPRPGMRLPVRVSGLRFGFCFASNLLVRLRIDLCPRDDLGAGADAGRVLFQASSPGGGGSNGAAVWEWLSLKSSARQRAESPKAMDEPLCRLENLHPANGDPLQGNWQ